MFTPQNERLIDNISAILPQIDRILLIENGSDDTTYINGFVEEQIEVIKNDENMGIAYALNQVMQYAHDNGYEWALTLDQDSVVPPDLIEKYMKLTSIDKVGMICCKIVDRNFGETTEQKSKTSGYEEVPMCITSASMLNWTAWKEVGGFAEEFFIDAVDFDMCLLLREHGYKIIRTYDTQLLHEVGHSQIRKLFGKEYLVYHHSPLRYYYMVRNGLYLGKRHHFVIHSTIRAFSQIAMALIYEDRKKEKLTMMAKGFWHAIIGRYGKY